MISKQVITVGILFFLFVVISVIVIGSVSYPILFKYPAKIPDFIGGLEFEVDDNRDYTVSFRLTRKDGSSIEVDGTAQVKIVDRTGQVLYEEDISIKKEDFKFYLNASTGVNSSRYELKIMAYELRKRQTNDGRVSVTFSCEGASFGEIDKDVIFFKPKLIL
ncbi:MAG: hypothetical protein ABH834_00190 [Candidatus Altiarchaeota archaeon]